MGLFVAMLHKDRGCEYPKVLGSIGTIASDEFAMLHYGTNLCGIRNVHALFDERFLTLPRHVPGKVSKRGSHGVGLVGEADGFISLVGESVACGL